MLMSSKDSGGLSQYACLFITLLKHVLYTNNNARPTPILYSLHVVVLVHCPYMYQTQRNPLLQTGLSESGLLFFRGKKNRNRSIDPLNLRHFFFAVATLLGVRHFSLPLRPLRTLPILHQRTRVKMEHFSKCNRHRCFQYSAIVRWIV